MNYSIYQVGMNIETILVRLRKPEYIEESALKSLYENFFQTDLSYKSEKCRGFANNQLKSKTY